MKPYQPCYGDPEPRFSEAIELSSVVLFMQSGTGSIGTALDLTLCSSKLGLFRIIIASDCGRVALRPAGPVRNGWKLIGAGLCELPG